MMADAILGYGKPKNNCKIYNILGVTDVKMVENFKKIILTLRAKRYNIILILCLDRNAR